MREALGNDLTLLPIQLHLRAPEVVMGDVRVAEGWRRAAVQVELVNRGDQDAGVVEVAAAFWRDGRQVADLGVQRPPGTLAAEGRVTLPFDVPEALRDFRRFELRLRVRGAIWPSHEWTLVTTRRVGWRLVLYGASALLVAGLGLGLVRARRDATRAAGAARAPAPTGHPTGRPGA